MRLAALILAVLAWLYSCGGNNPQHYCALKWGPSTTPGVTYMVYRQVGGGTFTRFAPTAATNYVDSAVASGVRYSYYVTALDADGESTPTNTISLVVP
jgi:fibronectin type 3 domain-containing protein